MEKSNSNVELFVHHKQKNSGILEKLETRNDDKKNGTRLGNDMSQTVSLFKKYLLAKTQGHNIGKTNMEESEVIKKSPSRPLSPFKLSPNSSFRPPTLLEQELFPELRCNTIKSTPSRADKASTAHLTIFYAGGVNVYDNVSAEKAKHIMLILGGESPLSKPLVREAPKPDFKAPPPQSVRKSKPGIQLARKYSLQCFLEKRRHRLINKSPYALLASNARNGAEHGDKEAKGDTELKENHCSSLAPFPSRLGYFFPVSANKSCY